MLKRIFTIALIFITTYLISAERSKEWERVRKDHLKIESCCVICGTMKDRQVHHKQPFQFRPDLELIDSNLVTVCTSKYWGFNCHFSIAHAGNFKYENPWINEDIEKVKEIGNPAYTKEHGSDELDSYITFIHKRCKKFTELRLAEKDKLAELSTLNYVKEHGDTDYADLIDNLKIIVMQDNNLQ